MTRINFVDSFGDDFDITYENLEWFKEQVFKVKDDFWWGEVGMCALYFYRDKSPSDRMHLIARERLGFNIEHRYQKENKFLTLMNETKSNDLVEVVICGDLEFYFKQYFVSSEMAWTVIEHFINTGERKENLRWVEKQSSSG